MRAHLSGVGPSTDELADRRLRVETPDVTVEQPGLAFLIADGHVARAPPDLERHPGEGDPPRIVEWTAGFVSAGIRHRCTADLAPREPLQSGAEGKEIESPVTRRHVRRRIEGRCTGQQPRKAREQEKRFLSAHAAAERVHAMTLDPQPGDGSFREQRHPREVANLPGVAPGEEPQLTALTFGIDDGEAAARGQVSPPPNVRPRADTPPVRRDDQRYRGMLLRPVPGGQDQVRPPRQPVMSPVVDRQNTHCRSGLTSEGATGKHRGDRGENGAYDRHPFGRTHRTKPKRAPRRCRGPQQTLNETTNGGKRRALSRTRATGPARRARAGRRRPRATRMPRARRT